MCSCTYGAEISVNNRSDALQHSSKRKFEHSMTKLALAAFLSFVAGGAVANSTSAPSMDPRAIANDTSSSTVGALTPILSMLLLVAAVGN